MPPDTPPPKLGDLDPPRMPTPKASGAGGGNDKPTNLTGHPTHAIGRTPVGHDPQAIKLQPAWSPSGPFPFFFPPVEPDELGRLGNYRILRLLGQGGMGLVFQAEDIALRRPVALKVMRPELSANPDNFKRFVREAQTMAASKHDHLVTVYQVGQENNVIFLAMELLAGETLDEWLARIGRAPVTDVLRLGREIAAGLAVIHAKGLIHRDIKPDNIWLEAPAGRVKILDFGLARIVNASTRLTDAGSVVGTPDFMSPEQARGDEIDARSDLFSLGGVLYRLCTGANPFPSANLMGVLTALAVTDPRPVQELNPAVPDSLADLVMRLLAKEPADRLASAEEVIGELQRIESGLTSPLSPVRLPSRPREPATRSQRSQPPAHKQPLGQSATWVIVGLAALTTLLAVLFVQKINRQAEATVSPSSAPAPSQPAAEKYYLSLMTPVTRERWPGPPVPPIPGLPPGAVSVQGKFSPHGIFMHAAPPEEGPARVSYRLGKQFRTFHVEVSQNDGVPHPVTPCTFFVYGDGKPLWTSRPVASQADRQAPAALDVRGVETLTLEVRCPGDPRGAHMVWVEPYLEK